MNVESNSDLLSSLWRGEMNDIGVMPFAVVLLVSAAAAFLVAFLYRWFYDSRSSGSEIHRAFPLLGLSVSAIFICIQFSLPLSLGLLGALSIVRFRTPVKEPEEIGFVMLVIASSLACATFNFLFLAALLLVAIAALLVKRASAGAFARSTNGGLLLVRMNAGAAPKLGEVLALLGGALRGAVESVAEQGENTTVSFRFRRAQPNDLAKTREQLATTAPGCEVTWLFTNDPA